MPEFEIEFPLDMAEEVEALLKETGETFSDFVNRALKDALKDLDEGHGPAGGRAEHVPRNM